MTGRGTQQTICLETTLNESFEDTLAFANSHVNIGVDHYIFFWSIGKRHSPKVDGVLQPAECLVAVGETRFVIGAQEFMN